jgi:ATP-binding cassette subfamily B protein
MRRAPFVPQMETAECGAACLAMVLARHGCSVPLAELRQACGVSRDGVSALAIVETARAYGCDAQGVRVSSESLRELPRPAILHWGFNHFVVLERAGRRGALIIDPAHGRRHVPHAELEEAFTGVALVIEPGAAFQRRTKRDGSQFSFRRALAGSGRALAVLLGASLLLEIAGVLAPAATQLLVDHVLPARREKWFWMILLALGAGTFTRGALYWLREWILRGIQFAVDVSLMSRFVDHMLHLPAPYFDQRTPGDLGERVDANSALRDVGIQMARAGLDGLLLLVYGVMMLAYDARLGGVVLALNVLRVAVVMTLTRTAQQLSAIELVQRAREQSAVIEAFTAPEVIKACGAELLVRRRFGERLAGRLDATLQRERFTSWLAMWSAIVQALSHGTVLWVGGTAVIDQEISMGVLAGFLTLQQLSVAPLDSLVGGFADVTHAQGILARINDVFTTPRAPTGGERLVALRGEVVFENVSFRYGPRSPLAVRNVSFRVRPGEKIAVVGRSGQGKSTIARLLLGMAQPTEGRVLIDGRDLRTLDRAHLLAQVGVVLQDSFLFDDSVQANLALRHPQASPQQLWRAARLACVDEAIARLPHGPQTRVGPNGRRLSGGQRQRLCLARALVGEPRMLVLDESTSALDADTEAQLHRNLATLSCTRILIAHRLSTVEDADRILVIEAGTLVDQGTFAELTARAGVLQAMRWAVV